MQPMHSLQRDSGPFVDAQCCPASGRRHGMISLLGSAAVAAGTAPAHTDEIADWFDSVLADLDTEAAAH